ncbi:hypothetical protein OKA04_19125 [Luteolibacter flavescens]|uniref:Uncharacterized protein n=1 Tax=Luteolibacter flavescens TaxID=1859460 RepID=A0ABT3FTH4_9BACT|nr:hypothetical protein [Luteolibacter flavescens]MCW1886860.1 hypothetical protein [Luteolibacter flavescens]
MKTSQHFCKDCHEAALSGPAKGLMADLKAGRCHHCGAQAVMTDNLSCISGEAGGAQRYLCFSCSNEANEVAMEKFRAFEDGDESLPISDHQQKLREIVGQIDAHMRRWVIQRYN